jgi:hypothetical protein
MNTSGSRSLATYTFGCRGRGKCDVLDYLAASGATTTWGGVIDVRKGRRKDCLAVSRREQVEKPCSCIMSV